MLVLNRRPGESIVIEPDLRVTVVSVAERRVWIELRSPSLPSLRVSATVVSADEARLEIVPMAGVAFDGGRIRLKPATALDVASVVRAGLALDRKPGERVEVGDDLFVALESISKGNPAVAFGGAAIGEPFRITLIRPAGSYVRLGVDAPSRRVYREELWDVVRASGGGLKTGVVKTGLSEAGLSAPGLGEDGLGADGLGEDGRGEDAVPADMAAGSPAG